MANLYRLFLVLALLLLAAPGSLHAQQLTAGKKTTYKAERQLIESTLQTIVAVIQEATLQKESSGISERLRQITGHLTRAARMIDTTPDGADQVTADDLEELRRLLLDIAQQLEALREALEEEEAHDIAERIAPIERDLQRAIREVDDIAEEEHRAADDDDRWLRSGRYESRRDRARRRGVRERDREREARDRKREINEELRERIRQKTEDIDDWERDRKRRRRDDRWYRFGWSRYGTFVGEYSFRWPYRRETALYSSIPAMRYNRVEGFVLGVGRRPLDWDSYGRARLYGQVGYAFALDDVRFEVGAESRIDNRRRDDFGLKVGGAYHQNTGTRDSWKTSWLENSLAALTFENDFFDYYDVEGWTLYAVQRITPFIQVSAGYRQDDYRSMEKETSWSLFDGNGFPFNPPIDEGRMQSFIFTAEGGSVQGLHSLPNGAVFRLEAEIGKSIGGDFSFNRYIADARVYLPLSYFSSLGLRLRGGLATGDFVPLQKEFSLGGIGSVRAYPQNGFAGTRMLLGNAEYIIDDISIFNGWFDDFQLIGFVDAGWVNMFGTHAFDFDDVFTSAGIGLGLDDRAVRLELAWPLRDFGGDQDPTLWLRIAPTF
ncbi:MAG: DUF5686 family protein [Rhodothermales bacterium]